MSGMVHYAASLVNGKVVVRRLTHWRMLTMFIVPSWPADSKYRPVPWKAWCLCKYMICENSHVV